MGLSIDERTFYGSLMITKDRKMILGEEDIKHLILLKSLQKAFKYASAQYNAGNITYYAKAKILRDKINKLKKCEKICNYSQRLLLSHSCVNP